MASRRSRRGSFGLQPRVAPNVSNQMVALAREYVAKRDALIMDAWRNGGTFEGKKATDDMVLAYWRERGRGLDPDDPEYETSRNNIMQLQYAIEQSKADLKHVQGKMSDGEYAQFFIKWSKKVPKNSEFYRTLQKDAAQLIESAKAKSRAAGERARVESFNSFVKTTTARDIAIGDALTAALSDLSQKTGLSITGNGDELLDLLSQNVRSNPGQYSALLDTLRAGDPNFNGTIDQSYFATHIKQAARGYDLIADRAQAGGFVSAYNSATKGEAAMSEWGQNLKVWPVAQSYTQAENAFFRVWNDPNASQMDKQTAAAAFSARLTKLASTPGIDVGSRTMIEADAQRLLGQDAGDNPSFGTSMLGRVGVDPKMTMQIGAWTKMQEEMTANPLAYGYAPVDANGQFDPSGRGALGIVPAGAIPPGAQAVVVPGANGQAVMAMVMPHSVYTTDPNNPSGAPQLAGYQISYNVGGRTIEMWGYKDAAGGNHWSLTSPLAEGSTVTKDNKGDVYVSPQASAVTDPLARAKQLDAQFGTNLAAQLQSQLAAGSPLGGVTAKANQVDDKGRILASFSLTYKNGQFTATNTQNTLDTNGRVIGTQTTPINIAITTPQGQAFSPSRLSAGDINGITFNSPLQASVAASQGTQTTDQISKFASDPAFQQAFLSQTMQTLGTSNPFDSRIADAWKNITTPQINRGEGTRSYKGAADRGDLTYPGEQVKGATVGINIGFGPSGGTLRLPNLPSYLNAPAPGGGTYASQFGGLVGGLTSMLPGLGPTPAQTPTGSPAPTSAITPTAKPPSATPTVSPSTGFTTPPPVTPIGVNTTVPAPKPVIRDPYKQNKPGDRFG